MGQAKQRGNYEARKAEGVLRRQEETRKAKMEAAARDAALTPEQRDKRHRDRLFLAALAGLALGTVPAHVALDTMMSCRTHAIRRIEPLEE